MLWNPKKNFLNLHSEQRFLILIQVNMLKRFCPAHELMCLMLSRRRALDHTPPYIHLSCSPAQLAPEECNRSGRTEVHTRFTRVYAQAVRQFQLKLSALLLDWHKSIFFVISINFQTLSFQLFHYRSC